MDAVVDVVWTQMPPRAVDGGVGRGKKAVGKLRKELAGRGCRREDDSALPPGVEVEVISSDDGQSGASFEDDDEGFRPGRSQVLATDEVEQLQGRPGGCCKEDGRDKQALCSSV